MAGSASPIDIAPPRYNSSSPRNQTSNLTSALQEAGASEFQLQQNTPTNSNNVGASETRMSIGARNDSISNGFGSYYGTGARPINTKEMPRRESNTGSLVGGMSWGGVSMGGSWIRDEMLMSTSPAMGQSPSFHSSSYLPKMEANFMKDFFCCGLTHASLHDLLTHYEEAHAQGQPQPQRSRTSFSTQGGLPGPSRNGATPGPSLGRAGNPIDPAAYTQHGFQTTPSKPTGGFSTPRTQRLNSDGFNRTTLSTVQDMDSLDDMELDDAMSMPMPNIDETTYASQQQFGGQDNNMSRLNVNVANALQNQGFRGSTPTTPMATSQPFNIGNNPTVSSVNTPTLGSSTLQNGRTPDSSTPGTPAEFNEDYSAYSGMLMPNGMMPSGDLNFNIVNFGGANTGFDGTIDQPAKRLFSKTGAALSQQQLALAFRQAQSTGDIAMQQQLLSNMQGMQEEVKPFRCPVIGCEKAYKNQNGLKYHKTHGHQNQQLKENEDGSFSIVDPVTSVPYPGHAGMEKEKPYRCDYCGKRYKNLNGLKYHRQHSVNCNPDLKLGQLNVNGLPPINMHANVAGAGLGNMDTSMF